MIQKLFFAQAMSKRPSATWRARNGEVCGYGNDQVCAPVAPRHVQELAGVHAQPLGEVHQSLDAAEKSESELLDVLRLNSGPQ
jgi:hypothetical protein